MTPPAPELAERFRTCLTQLLGSDAAGAGRVALAVSGGPDSMAMLALTATAFPGRTIAATVDHGLRPESGDEAAMVAGACVGLGVPHATLSVEVPPGATGNLQAWARQERYLLLKRWAVDADALCLCTAHHAEDQAETFLMRAARAAGLSGLAAVRARVDDSVASREQTRTELVAEGFVISVFRQPVTLLRPLLHWRRAELRGVAEASGLPFVDDPSNADPRFTRTRFRNWLAQADWIDAVQVARSAEHLAQAESDLLAVSQWLWTERALPSEADEARFDVAGLPRAVRRTIARKAIEHVMLMRGTPIEGADLGSIEPLLDALEAGRGATHAYVQAAAKGDVWTFREAPPRRAG